MAREKLFLLAKNKLALALSVSLALAIILSVLFSVGFLSSFQLGISDNFYSEKPVGGEIVIIGIDDASLQEIGRWPWDRDVHAGLINVLNEKGAKVIGIDISFFEASDKDSTVEDALNKFGNVVLVSEYTDFVVEDGQILGASILKPVFAADSGFANIFTDSDGIVRSFPAFIRGSGVDSLKHFSIAVLEKYTDEGIEFDGTLLINYFGPPGHFTTLSFSDVINNRTDANFANKIVLVGATAPDLRDTFLTPISHTQEMPGVEVHANIIETILTGSFLNYQDQMSVIALIFLFSIITGLILYRFRVILATIIVAILAVVYVLFAALQFDSGIIMNIVYPILSVISVYVANVAVFYTTEKKQRKFVTNIFGKYVSKEVADEILRKTTTEELLLKGEKRTITILFSDIRSFTSISEKLRPEELVSFLNKYLSEMTDVIMQNRGVVDKYIGDAIMAFWGAPLEEKNHVTLACDAALDMKRKLEETKMEFKIGVGINTGEAVVGNMGSAQRVNYTAIGDVVNAASRLEGLNKEYGTAIIIGEPTYQEIKDDFVCRELDLIKVKGKDVPIRIYELVGRKGEVDKKELQLIGHFHSGLDYYRKKKWTYAIAEFREAMKIRHDHPSHMFIERCRLLQKKAPKEWNGVFTMKTK